jgi:UDP-2-acetamido-2,6-beta-L-arabino-hexul-4-ose reductase
MLKIGITGQSGFIGTHLYNTLSLFKERFVIIEFEDVYFELSESLKGFVIQCDIIVHLAAVNRHENPESLYHENLELTQKLINALKGAKAAPHILFSSSIQEKLDNPYGRAKRDSRNLLISWAGETNARFSGLIIPNVFGPFCKPNYNSVVATFCHQLALDEKPQIIVDSELKLIYVGELVVSIINHISSIHEYTNPTNVGDQISKMNVPETKIIYVSELLSILTEYKTNYFQSGVIPNLTDEFMKNLFNTFLCYIDHAKYFPHKYSMHSDKRGSFVVLAKTSGEGQISFSFTKPGLTRGNHFHTRKAERFSVIKGKAIIELRKIGTSEKFQYFLDGDNPSFVDMPIWHTHNITNAGEDELITVFWVNEYFDPKNPDTHFEEV